MDTIYLKAINKESKTFDLFWLHGMGVDGADFEELQSELQQYAGIENANLILPTAPERKITMFNKEMPAWFDLNTDIQDDDFAEDIAGMNESVRYVQEIIEERHEKYPENQIVIGGFSQGAVIALLAGYTLTEKIDAIICLSGFIPRHSRLDEISDIARKIPVFIGHGSLDSVVPALTIEEGCERLSAIKASYELHTYPMGHEISPEEVKDLGEFLKIHLTR